MSSVQPVRIEVSVRMSDGSLLSHSVIVDPHIEYRIAFPAPARPEGPTTLTFQRDMMRWAFEEYVRTLNNLPYVAPDEPFSAGRPSTDDLARGSDTRENQP